jgi:hypothetical protein
MVQYVWVILILSLASAGLVLMGFALGAAATPVSGIEWASSFGCACATIVTLFLIAPKKRLRKYAVLQN